MDWCSKFMAAQSDSLAVAEIFNRGGPIMWVILAAAVIGSAFFLERFYVLRADRVVPGPFVSRIRGLVVKAKIAEAKLLCEEHSSGIARVMAAALTAHRKNVPRAAVKEIVEEVGAREVSALEKHIEIVGTVASVSPLLGLFGTVVGMIQVFRRFSESYSAGGASPDHFADGIYTALITTAYGLMVAIPMLVAYKYLQGRMDRLVVAMEEHAMGLVDLLVALEDGSAADDQDGRHSTEKVP